MANKKENKTKNLIQPKEKKAIAEKVQLRLSQLDKKSANIFEQLNSLQKRLGNSNKLKLKIKKLKVELANVKKAKELELDELSLMCSLYTKTSQTKLQIQERSVAESSVRT
jgi:hypothetical protein